MKILFEILSELAQTFSIENPIQIGRKPKIRALIFPICIEFSIEKLSSYFETISNNFFTFYAVKSKLINLFPKFWILVKAHWNP